MPAEERADLFERQAFTLAVVAGLRMLAIDHANDFALDHDGHGEFGPAGARISDVAGVGVRIGDELRCAGLGCCPDDAFAEGKTKRIGHAEDRMAFASPRGALHQ